MFGTNATLPLDTVCGVNPAQEIVASELVQANADKNRIEAQTNYKDRLDKAINTFELAVGDTVLMKRTFGKNPKLSVKWKEDNKGQPYTIINKVGPVNYAIRVFVTAVE